MNILITGATGFIGRVLTQKLLTETQHELRLPLRNNTLTPELSSHPKIKIYQVDDITRETDWRTMLQQCDVVIHLAARVHMMKEHPNMGHAYKELNVAGTMQLAKQAIDAKVKRFIFISTIKVNGEEQAGGKMYTSEDVPNPQDAYARSKLKAELKLLSLSKKSNLEVTIIRPPLVYGPMVKGNLKTMMHWLKKGLPLPLGNTGNARSLVSVYNLSDLIITCMTHPKAANEIFLVSDGKSISTTVLLQKMGQAMGIPVRLFSLPRGFLSNILILMRQKATAKRLLGSLELDISKTQKLLAWQPKSHLEEVLKSIATQDIRN